MIDVDHEIAGREPLEQVARDDAPERLRAADTDRSEQLPIRDEREPVRPAGEAPVQASAHERDGTERWGVIDAVDDGDAVPGILEDLGEPRRLIRGEHDPGTVIAPRLDGVRKPTRTSEWQCRFAPPEQIARSTGAAGHGHVRRRFRLPRQLEGPRSDEATLPVARGQVRRLPVLRQLGGLDQFGAALVRLAPQEPGRLGDISGLVDDQQRPRVDVIERGRWRQVRSPDFRSVPDRQRPRLPGELPGDVGGGSQRVVGRALEPGKIAGEPI